MGYFGHNLPKLCKQAKSLASQIPGMQGSLGLFCQTLLSLFFPPWLPLPSPSPAVPAPPTPTVAPAPPSPVAPAPPSPAAPGNWDRGLAAPRKVWRKVCRACKWLSPSPQKAAYRGMKHWPELAMTAGAA